MLLLLQMCMCQSLLIPIHHPMKFVIGDMNGYGELDIVLFFTTVFFFLLLYCASLNLSYFLDGTMKVMSIPLERQNRIKSLMHFIVNYGYLFSVIGGLASCIPFFTLKYTSRVIEINQSYQIIYYILMTVQGSILVYLLTLILGETAAFLAAHNDNHSETTNKIAVVHSNLTFQFRLTAGRLLISTSWMVFSTWPFLRRKFTYYYCVYYLFTYFSGLISFKALWNFKSTATVAPAKYNIVAAPDLAPPPAPAAPATAPNAAINGCSASLDVESAVPVEVEIIDESVCTERNKTCETYTHTEMGAVSIEVDLDEIQCDKEANVEIMTNE